VLHWGKVKVFLIWAKFFGPAYRNPVGVPSLKNEAKTSKIKRYGPLFNYLIVKDFFFLKFFTIAAPGYDCAPVF